MIRRLALAIILASLVATNLQAGVYSGQRGRALCRNAYLVRQWQGDKLEVYNQYGFPVHRLRVRGYGRVLEHWTYHEHGREFIFDQQHRLVEVKTFRPENRRERFERFDARPVRNPR